MGYSLSDLFGGASQQAGSQAVNPGGPVTGGAPLSGLKNALEGNPAGAADAITKLQQQAYQQGTAIKNFLMANKAQSQKYFAPMQQMFGSMYGSKGLQPVSAPGVPGSAPLGPGGG